MYAQKIYLHVNNSPDYWATGLLYTFARVLNQARQFNVWKIVRSDGVVIAQSKEDQS